jgi:hypothetical protein
MFDERLNWDHFVSIRREQSTNFRRHLRMSKSPSKSYWGSQIKTRLNVDQRMASICGGEIMPNYDCIAPFAGLQVVSIRISFTWWYFKIISIALL